MSGLIFTTEPSPAFPEGVACRLVHLSVGLRYLLYNRAAHDWIGAEKGYNTTGEARAAIRRMERKTAVPPTNPTDKR